MTKSTFPQIKNFDEEVISCLQEQMIPTWEQYNVSHLAIAAGTLAEFDDQKQPQKVSAWKTSARKRSKAQHKRMYRGSLELKVWPNENQYIGRFPVLLFVRKGQTQYRVGDYVIQCPAGHFLFLPSGTSKPTHGEPHFEKPREGKQCEIWRFNSTGFEDYVSLAVCYSDGDEHANSGHFYIVNNSDVARLFLTFSWEISNRALHYEKLCQSTLQSFFYLFLREIQEGRFYDRGRAEVPSTAPLTTSPIESARQYIDRNLHIPLTIDIVAQAVFMSRTNFIRQFREETGTTFNKYLTKRRLEEAQHWLTQESCSLDKVCQFVGIKHTRLHELFRLHFGMTPTEFRNKTQKQ